MAAARARAGWLTTADLARATGRAARAIYALENAEPTVGQTVLHAVGRTLGQRLPGWDEQTPRLILEGAEPPDGSSPTDPEPDADPWTQDDEDFYRFLTELLAGKGLRPTPEIMREMRRQWEIEHRKEADEGQYTERGESNQAS